MDFLIKFLSNYLIFVNFIISNIIIAEIILIIIVIIAKIINQSGFIFNEYLNFNFVAIFIPHKINY